jgi:7TM-HD extracellular
MVKNIIHSFQLVCVLTLLCSLPLYAKDVAAYNVGDIVDEDITTPVALNVIDPQATASKRSEIALTKPVIFRYFPSITNDIATDFIKEFDKAHQGFLAALDQKYQRTVLDSQSIGSSDFGATVSAFNKKSKNFPISTNLAILWASGKDGESVKTTILGRMTEAMRRPIHEDDMPAGLPLGDTVCIVHMKNKDDSLTVSEAEAKGKVGTQTSFTTLTHARSIVRKAFPEDEQLTAKALMAMIKPTCFVDEQLTKLSRDSAVAQIAIPVQIAAGTVVARKGQTVDAKMKAVFDQLKNNSVAMKMLEEAKRSKELAAEAQSREQAAKDAAAKANQMAQQANKKLTDVQSQAHANNLVLLTALGGVLVVSILMVGTVWWLVKQRQVMPVPAMAQVAAAAPVAAPVAVAPAPVQRVATNGNGAHAAPAEQKTPAFKINIAPPPVTTTASREPMVQEMAAPMAAPVPAPVPVPAPPVAQTLQDVADNEISQLVKRLDKLYAPAHDRLRTYQLRIEDFERELAQRDVANPDLLKLKIEALNRQMELERKKNRINSDWGSV